MCQKIVFVTLSTRWLRDKEPFIYCAKCSLKYPSCATYEALIYKNLKTFFNFFLNAKFAPLQKEKKNSCIGINVYSLLAILRCSSVYLSELLTTHLLMIKTKKSSFQSDNVFSIRTFDNCQLDYLDDEFLWLAFKLFSLV